MKKTLLTLFACAGSMAVGIVGFGVPAFAKPVETELQFMNHPEAMFPEQDVFVTREGFPATEVYRVEGDDAQLDDLLEQPAYAASVPVEHDPFKLGQNPLGPFRRGALLGFTLGEWLEGTGGGSYTVDDGRAELDLSFENLVPRGLYTVWCSRIKLPPNPTVTDSPCGAPDGSENAFNADGEGSAKFALSMDALAPSTDEVLSVVALAYHSDGKTHGISPGEFGLNSHVQIFSMLPVPDKSAGAGTVETGTVLVWVVIGIIVVLIVVNVMTKPETKPAVVERPFK